MTADVTLWLVGVLTAGVMLAAGVGIGYHLQSIYEQLKGFKHRLNALEQEPEEPGPQVFDAKTPKEIKQYGEPDTDESQIIRAKTPKELQRERDRKIQEDIARSA